MAEQTHGSENDRSNTKSSIDVAQQTVCEDDACIGMSADPAAAAPSESEEADEKQGQSSASSMAAAGEEICSDDACIGKG